MEPVYTLESLNQVIRDETGVLVYFSSESCSVCKVLRPKVDQFLKEQYPSMRTVYVDIEKSPVLSGQHRIFAIPAILLFFEGKESHRFSRNISLSRLEEAIDKPYGFLFESTNPSSN